MLKWFAHRYIRGMEKRYGYDATYMHEMLDTTMTGFRRFMKIQNAGTWQGDAPANAWWAAGLAGALVEDCGPCVQIGTDLAMEGGMNGEIIEALLSGTPTDADAQLGFDYGRALLLHSGNLDQLRETIEGKWGTAALIALSLRAMTTRNFPVLKRALGHAKTCQRVRIGGAEVAVNPVLKGRMSDIAVFEGHRVHLRSIAYRMLGEMAAAEDVVQEAWLRWRRAEDEDIRDPRAWLSAVTVRLSLDALRKARARRETYVGPWLPEPILPDDMRAFAADAPTARAELASDLSLALLHVLERLSPEERAALILHDAFDCDYVEIAATLEKNEAACRKLVSRARERVKADRPRFTVSQDAHRDLLLRFAKASASSDPGEMAALLAPDAIAYTDGGGRVAAALNPIYGPDKITRFILGLGKKFYAAAMLETALIEINGQPALLIRDGNEMLGVIAIETDGERIITVYGLRNPEKLRRLTESLSPSAPGSSPPA